MKHSNTHAATLGSLTSLVETLRAAGEPIEIAYPQDYPRWTPDWVPYGYSRIAWEKATPAEVTWAKEDDEAREVSFASALERCSKPNDSLLLVYEGQQAFIRTSHDAVMRHVQTVLEQVNISGSPLWVTSPPDQWLIEVGFEMTSVGEPFPATSGLTELEQLQETLQHLKVPYEVLDMPPGHPALPDVPLLPIIPPLRATFQNDQISALVEAIHKFVVERLGSETVVQLIPAGTPRFHVARTDFLLNLEVIVRRAVSLNVSAPAANWCLDFRRRLKRTWIEGRY